MSRCFAGLRPQRLAFALLLGLAQSSVAQLRMPAVFGDHMVLQQKRPMVFYGTAPAGDTVKVLAAEAQGSAQAGADGRWSLSLGPPPEGRAFEVQVSTPRETLRFRDVLAGEVWVVSGQSNMEWPIGFLPEGKAVSATASNAQLRLLHIPQQRLAKPSDATKGQWQTVSADSVRDFSAIGYYFGQGLQQQLGQPVGIIQVTWGGSNIEPWIPRSQWLAAQRRGELKPRDMGGGLIWLGTMYNGMVHALTRSPVRGVLWYQGESNVKNGERYLPKLQLLIRSWRQAWGQPQLPFYLAELSPFDEQYGGEKLPPIWQVQTQVLDGEPGTGIVATQDLNPELAVHPPRKRPVAERFLQLVLARQYGQAGLVDSPRFASLKPEGGALRLRFQHAQGLQVRNQAPALGFELAGSDGQFYPAYAQIQGEEILLRSAQVPQPQRARYAWDFELAAMVNVVNAAELPLLPFQSP